MKAPLAGEGLRDDFAPGEAARQAVDALGATPAAIIVFVGHRGTGEAALAQVAPLSGGAPVAVIECAGVLTSAGEREGKGVAAFALGPDAAPRMHALPADPDAARAALEYAGERAALLWSVLTPPLYHPEVVAAPGSGPGATPVVGGGGARAWVSLPGEAPRGAAGVALGIHGAGLRATTMSSPAARILTEWRPLTEVSGQFLVSAGGASMLEWIATTPGTTREGSPTFVAVRAENPDDAPLLRTVAGIDPKRGGVAVSEPIELGTQVALGVWDGEAARSDLTARVGGLARSLRGAAPVAAVVMTCLGRGVDLFGGPDVDVGAVRTAVGAVPLAGMFSQFEIARFNGTPRIHLYTASIAVLFRPS